MSPLACGDGSAEALRSFVPERILDPLSLLLSHAVHERVFIDDLDP